MKRQKGFTLIELVLVLVVISVLIVFVIPQFVDISGSAEDSAIRSTVDAINNGTSLYRANDSVINQNTGTYPQKLDNVPNGTVCSPANTCFVNVLMSGISDPHWKKTGDNKYTYSSNRTNLTYEYFQNQGLLLKQ